MEWRLAEQVRRLENELQLQRERTASDEVIALRNELELAMEAEENNKEAMEELALVIKEVAAEANQAKEKLRLSSSEATRLKALIKSKAMEAKGREDEANKEKETLSNTIDQLQVEAEESLLAWSGKEIEFIKLIKEEENEKASMVEENRKLLEALTELGEKSDTLREETEKLRGVFNEALDGADVAREARAENLQLKDSLAEKERTLAILIQDVERLRVYEAAAHENIKERGGRLFPFLSNSKDKEAKSHEEELKNEWESSEEEQKEEEQQKPGVASSSKDKDKDEPKPAEEKERRMLPSFSKRSLLPSFSRKKDAAVVDKELKPHAHAKPFCFDPKAMIPLPGMTSKTKEVGESTDLRDDDIKDSIFHVADSPPPLHSRKHRRTFSSINEDTSSSLEEFEPVESPHYDDMEVERAGSHFSKKKVLLWRFGDLLKRKNHHPHQTQSTLNHKEVTT